MLLRATLRDKHGDDFIRTIDVLSGADFDKVGRAAFSWARGRARAMGAYAPTSRVELVLQMEWVEPQKMVVNAVSYAKKRGSGGKQNSAVRRGRSGRRVGHKP